MRYIFSILLLTILANSEIINGIAIKVNSILITLYDIEKAQQELKQNRKNIVQLLIQNALEESEIERLHLVVSENDTDRFISNIMAQNRIPSKEAFYKVLSYQGISKSEFLENSKKRILRQKLYQRISSNKIVPPTEEDIKEFYKTNLSKYSIAESYDVTIYLSKNSSSLKEKSLNPLLFSRDIRSEKKHIISKTLNSQMRSILSNTKLNSFSKITKLGDNYALFYINSINGKTELSFDEVRNEIENRIFLSQQKKIVDSHFKRVRATAIIEYLR